VDWRDFMTSGARTFAHSTGIECPIRPEEQISLAPRLLGCGTSLLYLSDVEVARFASILGLVIAHLRGSHARLRQGASVCVVPNDREAKLGIRAGLLEPTSVSRQEFIRARHARDPTMGSARPHVKLVMRPTPSGQCGLNAASGTLSQSFLVLWRSKMRSMFLVAVLAAVAGISVPNADAQDGNPQADFLLIGSYHMGNPGRDVHNTKADDVLSEKRQREIAEAVRLIEGFRPTKVMIEAGTEIQDKINARFAETCRGSRPLGRNETEQLGFRIACDMGHKTVYAVDWNDLGPFEDEDSVDYFKAAERHQQQKQYDAHLAIGRAANDKQQQILDRGTVLDMLKYLNSDAYLKQNAMSYYRIGMLGTPSDPIGANWVQLWFGRNLAIFNNIARNTDKGDRVLVVYGAGHGNYLRQLAIGSGIYQVHEPMNWLSPLPKGPGTATQK
jgi:Family of unknown function (DUF5694)